MAKNKKLQAFKLIKGKFVCPRTGIKYFAGDKDENGLPVKVFHTSDLEKHMPEHFERYDEVTEAAVAKKVGNYVPDPGEQEVDPYAEFGEKCFDDNFDVPEGFTVRGKGTGWYKVVRKGPNPEALTDKNIQEPELLDMLADMSKVKEQE